MRGRASGHITRSNIILQSFLLFCSKQYEEVTYLDIEHATKLSRGSILYHFKTKQELFDVVVEYMMFERLTILNIPVPEDEILKNFIRDFIHNHTGNQKRMMNLGIRNVHLAYYIIDCNAFCHFANFDKRLRQMRDVELGVWVRMVNKAIDKGEISGTIEAEVLGSLFMKIYYGHIFSSLKEDKSGDIQQLHKELLALYDLVKRS